MSDSLWRVTVNSLFPNDNKVQNIFEKHYADEAAACAAALRQEGIDNGWSTSATIVRVEELG